MKTDLAIIGAGPGGYVAALRAAQLGMQVTIVESAHLGGICLNRGCIPTKAMLQTATVAHEVRNAGTFGVMLDAPARIDYAAALARRDAVVARLRNGVRGLLRHGKVQIVAGRASFTGPRTLVVEPVSDDIGAGKSAALAAGGDHRGRSHHRRHRFKTAGPAGPRGRSPRVLDSDGALALTSVPVEHRGGRGRGCGLRVEPDLHAPGRQRDPGRDATRASFPGKTADLSAEIAQGPASARA